MSDTYTANYHWTKPAPGASDDTWGDKINADLDAIDAALALKTGGGGSTSVSVGDTPPLDPISGDLWFDSTEAQLFVWYDDGTSAQWVIAVNPTAGSSAGVIPPVTEKLTVFSTNSMAPLSQTPGAYILLMVNGQTFAPADGSFTVSGKTIVWHSTVFSINPGDTVVAFYTPGAFSNLATELVTVTAHNTLGSVSHTIVGFVLLYVNGEAFSPADGSFGFSGTTLTWLSTTFSVNPGDTVVAFYAH